MAWIRYLEKAQRFIENAFLVLGAVVAMALMFLITLDVIMRKLGHPVPGAYEIVAILHVGIVFLGVAYVQRLKGHIFIEIATEKLPEKIKQGLNFFGYLIGFIICAVLTRQSSMTAWEAFLTKEFAMAIVDIPVWPAKLVIALGMATLTLRLLWDMIFQLFPALRPEPTEDQISVEGEGISL